MKIALMNTTLLTSRQTIPDGCLLMADEKITAAGSFTDLQIPSGYLRVDLKGMYTAPGLIDLQINGGFGCDFTRTPATIWKVGEQLAQFGVTAFLPTIVTAPLEVSDQAMKVIKEGRSPNYLGAEPLGLHLEGPFLNPKKKGAHSPLYLQLPAPEKINHWTAQNGVRLVTLAPELPRALELVKKLCDQGVVVSAGHSMANYAQALSGFEAGIRFGTHIFNAMPAMDHRSPNLSGALLSDPRIRVGIIADGIHVHPAMVKLVWLAKKAGGLTLVSDAMSALGMDLGKYVLGNEEVIVDQTSARLKDGTLAGSILKQNVALRNLIQYCGCSPEEAIRTFTLTPANGLNIQDSYGSLEVGKRSDVVVFDRQFNVQMTIVGGQPVYLNDSIKPSL